MTMTTLRWCSVGVLAAALLAIGLTRPEQQADGPRSGPLVAEGSTPAVTVASASGADFAIPGRSVSRVSRSSDLASHREVMFHQSAGLIRTWEIDIGRTLITFRSYETQATGAVQVVSQEITTSFRIKDVAPRAGDHVFVGGEPSRGGFLIESWTFPGVTGAPTASTAVSGTAIGVSAPPATPQVSVSGGGPVLPVELRSVPPQPRRSVVVEDLTTGYRAIGADPEGRFVLLVTDEGELRQYDLGVAPGELSDPVVLADTTTLPSLRSVSGLMHRYQQATFGRLWIARWFDARYPDGYPIALDQWETMVLLDSDNDGIFEQMTSHLNNSGAMQSFLDPAQIQADFLNSST